MKIIFDVGANIGDSFIKKLSEDQDNIFLYMFEPVPCLIKKIKNDYKNLKNWHLEECAVSNFEGGWIGSSSLFDFHKDIKYTWPKIRTDKTGDLNISEIIKVKVITLKSFLLNHPEIKKIDYLHIDAQGSDLNVLKGLEEYIKIVENGQLEAANNAPLYDKSPSKEECINFLEKNNFKIEVRNLSYECDIFYMRNL